MPIKPVLKGYLFALMSLFAMSNVYIFSKAALQEITLSKFGFYWFAIALALVFLLALYRGTLKTIRNLPCKTFFVLLFLALFDIAGTYFFYRAIQTIPNPAVVAFLGNVYPVLVIFLSVTIFNERFNFLETIGIILTLFGAFMVSYRGYLGIKNMFVYGTQFIVLSSLLSSINAIIIKHNIKKIGPIVITLNRSIFLFLFFTITFPWQKESIAISISALENVALGAFIGPFLTTLSAFMVYKYLPVSRKAIVDSMRGLVVMVGAYFYFGSLPPINSIIGGVVSIIGVLFITIGKLQLKEKS